jgi:hypothetical protein
MQIGWGTDMNALIAMAAALPTIFGLQFGAPVTLPECVHSLLPNGRYSDTVYATRQIRPCQQLSEIEIDPTPNWGGVVFPVDRMPLILGLPNLSLTIMDNKLEGMSAATLDFWSADAIIDQLVEKFGPPTRRTEVPFAMRLRSVLGVQLLWIGEGYRIEYHAIGNSLDHGWLHVETDKARALSAAKQREIEKKRTPL